jgi:hypothetical protein
VALAGRYWSNSSLGNKTPDFWSKFTHFGAMTRQRAIELGLGRYRGELCSKHRELQGERLTANGYCYGCHVEKRHARRAADLARHRATARQRERSATYRAKRRERDSKPAVRASKHARQVRRRWEVQSDAAIDRAFAALSQKAKRLGMVIDHVVPMTGCRVCGERGAHEPGNWQLLTASENSAKGNRCRACWL